MLVRSEVDDEILTPLEVLSIVVLTHFGGSETPSHLITSALLALLDNPDTLTELRDDRALLPNLVEETLRHASPVNLVFQTAMRDVELHGSTIPGGSFVLSYISSANRHERRYDDPDRFDIHPNTDGHLSFAHGPHYCPGASIGRRMAQIAIGAVLERMPDLRRLQPETEWLPSLWVRGARSLPVAF